MPSPISLLPCPYCIDLCSTLIQLNLLHAVLPNTG